MEKWVKSQRKTVQGHPGGAGDWKERGEGWTPTLGLLDSAEEKEPLNQKKIQRETGHLEEGKGPIQRLGL